MRLVFFLFVVSCVGQLSTGPSSGSIPSNFKVSVEASTIDSNYNISLSDNTGTLFVRGVEYSALAYWTQVMDVFSGEGVWWINVVGVANDGSNLAIVYLDCTNGVLHDPFWEEDWETFLFDENMELRNASHTCDFQLTDWNVPVSFPSLDSIPLEGFPTGITITGKEISLQSDRGWFIYNGNNYTVVPISTVNCFNCASNCGSYSDKERAERNVSDASGVPYEYGCYPGPWYEIHHAAYLEGNPGASICFGIFYLFRQDHSFLQWNYTFCLPELTSPMVLFDAEWSGRLQGDPDFAFTGRHTPESKSTLLDTPMSSTELSDATNNNNHIMDFSFNGVKQKETQKIRNKKDENIFTSSNMAAANHLQ